MLTLYVQPAANFLGSKRGSVTSESSLTENQYDEQEIGHSDPDPGHTEAQPSTQNHNQKRNRDPIAFLYYSIILTTFTVCVAIVIGVIQLLTMILAVASPTGPFWDGVQTAGDYYDAIGGGICGCFLVIGVVSVFVYRPWRRWVDRRHGKDEFGEGNGPIGVDGKGLGSGGGVGKGGEPQVAPVSSVSVP